MRLCSLLLLGVFIVSPIYGQFPLPEFESSEESLFARRIVSCWEDCDYSLTLTQIAQFFDKYPNSPIQDRFQIIRGDIALKTEDFENAIDAYELVESPRLKKEIELHKWRALYLLHRYDALYQEIESVQEPLSTEGQFYLSETLFQKAQRLYAHDRECRHLKSLCQETLSLYKPLMQNEQYREQAMIAMAQLYVLLEQPELATPLYLQIVDETENEALMLYAATQLSTHEENRALAAFTSLAQQEGEIGQRAAYCWLKLLVDKRDWEALIAHEPQLHSLLSESDQSLLLFYKGLYAHSQERFQEASCALVAAIKGGLTAPYDKQALLGLALSTLAIEDMATLEYAYATYYERYPEDMEVIDSIQAQGYGKLGKRTSALALYEKIIEKNTSEEVTQRAYFEKIRLLVDAERWEEAYASLSSFLNQFPHSPYRPEACRLAIELSLTQVDREEGLDLLIEDLERVLTDQSTLNPAETIQTKILLAKAYLRLQRVQTALCLLESLPNDLAETHFLLTLCFLKQGSYTEKVVEHGERALSLNPTESQATSLHLHLFNAYLDLAQEQQNASLKPWAAYHLAEVINIHPVSLENRLWLAHFYAKELKEYERACDLLSSFFQDDDAYTAFEDEAALLASLYETLGENSQALEFLTQAVEYNPSAKLQLALAHSYYAMGEQIAALNLYQQLEASAELPIVNEARLYTARLRFWNTPSLEEKNNILASLKELWIRKVLANEPVHLEAAIDYAHFMTSLYPSEQQGEVLLHLLKQLKEHFSLTNDIWSKDYHASRELLPEKEIVYQAYLRYFDAYIYLIEAEQTKAAGSVQQGVIKECAAKTLFSTLVTGDYAVSNYLVQKAYEAMGTG